MHCVLCVCVCVRACACVWEAYRSFGRHSASRATPLLLHRPERGSPPHATFASALFILSHEFSSIIQFRTSLWFLSPFLYILDHQ